jgi:hypothetical protein
VSRFWGQPARDLEVAAGDRLDRLQRAFEQELSSSTSLNVRGATLGGFSAIALLLCAQFAATWLDDGEWRFGDMADTVLQVAFYASSAAFALCVLTSVWAIAPRRAWRADQLSRVNLAAQGEQAAEANTVASMLEKQRARNDRKSRWIQLASILMATGVVAVTAQALLFAVDADVVDRRPAGLGLVVPGAPAEVGLTKAQQDHLVRQYAPVVWLHSREEYQPMDPDTFLKGSSLTWRTRRGRHVKLVQRGHIDARRLGRVCGQAPQGCYGYGEYGAAELTRPFYDGDRPGGLPVSRGFALDVDNALVRGRGPEAPFLYEVGKRAADSELRITYWFFYGFSVPYRALTRRSDKNILPFTHEGDWENIDVVLGLLDRQPRRVEFYGHGRPQRAAWQEVQRSGNSHPIVYSARNSHASYSTAAPKVTKSNKVCRTTLGIRLCSWELRDQGSRWAPWQTGKPGLRDAHAQPWYGFGGAWGRAGGGGEATGPLGPSHWKLPND